MAIILIYRLRGDNSLDSYPDAFFDLIRETLQPDYSLRISADAALKHPALARVPKLLEEKKNENEY